MKHENIRGFTLLELLVSMVIISILSATVVLRVSSMSDRAALTQADQLRRDFSHAQALALSWGVTLRFTVTSSTGYQFTCASTSTGTPCSTLNAVPIDPATGQSFSVTLTDSVTISPTGSPNNTVDFDSLGRPTSSGSLLTASPARTYTVASANKSVSVTIQPVTGFAATS